MYYTHQKLFTKQKKKKEQGELILSHTKGGDVKGIPSMLCQ